MDKDAINRAVHEALGKKYCPNHEFGNGNGKCLKCGREYFGILPRGDNALPAYTDDPSEYAELENELIMQGAIIHRYGPLDNLEYSVTFSSLNGPVVHHKERGVCSSLAWLRMNRIKID